MNSNGEDRYISPHTWADISDKYMKFAFFIYGITTLSFFPIAMYNNDFKIAMFVVAFFYVIASHLLLLGYVAELVRRNGIPLIE